MNSILFCFCLLSMICRSFQIKTIYSSTKSSRLFSVKRLPNIETSSEIIKSNPARVNDLIEFLDHSPEPYHVVSSVTQRLQTHGFEHISESTAWRGKGLLKRG